MFRNIFNCNFIKSYNIILFSRVVFCFIHLQIIFGKIMWKKSVNLHASQKKQGKTVDDMHTKISVFLINV